MTQRKPPSWRRSLLLAALAGLVGLAPARADNLLLDFDDLGYSFLGAGDSFAYQGLSLTAASGLGDAAPGDLVGAIFDGNDPAMCQRLSCPTDNFTPGYYAGLNDGALLIKSSQPAVLQVKSFDASFIGAYARDGEMAYPGVAGLLEVRGYAADGSYLQERFALPGTNGTEFWMTHFDTSSAFASHSFVNVAIFAYSCNFAGECAAFKDNAGQFALDNLALNTLAAAVPEPSAWLMTIGGLGLIAAARRRRSA